jgi:hypothetical protein
MSTATVPPECPSHVNAVIAAAQLGQFTASFFHESRNTLLCRSRNPNISCNRLA